MVTLILSLIVFLTLLCVVAMIYRYPSHANVVVSVKDKTKLIISGVIAFVADTLGIGSFAVNVACAKLLNTFPDDQLPAVNNGAQVIPGMLEAFFFLKWSNVDLTTLCVLVLGTCIGGVIGGDVVSRLSKQAIRLTMIICFSGIIALLLCHQLRLMPDGGALSALYGWKLWVGFFATILCGMLTSAGIGLFALIQGVLFLLNVNPAAAFPIMMTAGALQQPLTTLMFLKHDKIPLKKTLIISLAGCIGVMIALPVVTHLTVTWLHYLLLGVLIYNVLSISRAYRQSRSYRDISEIAPAL